MPDLYRITFAFAGEKQGWTESYILPEDGTTPANVANGRGMNLALARKNLLAREYVMDAVRVAKVRTAAGAPVKRAVKLLAVDLAPNLQTVANAGDQPRACALVQASGADGMGTKHVFMRGIPDDIIMNGGGYNPNGAGGWDSRFLSFRALLLEQAPLGWLEDEILAGPMNVTDIIINANLTHHVTFSGNLFDGLAVGTRVPVALSGINNGKSRLNGRRLYSVLSATQAESVDAIAAGEYSSGGQGVRYNPIKPFQAAADWGIAGIRTHDTGRPIYATRGRQSAAPKV